MSVTTNRDEIREHLLRILGDIAPDADLSAIKPERSLRDQLDVDSMDLLNFVIAIDRELQVPIPESDYRKLTTLDGCVDYIVAHLGTNST
jgi:acyl carrier protein